MEAVTQEKDREVTVRRLAAGEESQFLSLADGYYQAMSALGVPGMKSPLSSFLEGFSRHLLQRMEEPHSVVLVASIDDEMIGGIIGTQYTAPACQDPEVYGVHEWGYVCESSRRHNIGSILVAALEVIFQEAGLKQIMGLCWQGNVIPQHYLLQRGYAYNMIALSKEL